MLHETRQRTKYLSTDASSGLESGGASRRSFLGGTGLAAVGAVIGGVMPLSKDSAIGVSKAQAQGGGASAPPAAKGPQPLKYPGKDSGLVVLGDRPLVAETPESFLDDDTTPTEKFFIRNNGQMPEETKDPDNWKFVIDGEVTNKVEITLGELKKKFKPVTRRLVIECGGNGRSYFNPQARGNQWTNGGIGCAEWTGVKLSDVLKLAGVKKSAVFSAHFGADPHLSGEKGKDAISRGVPIKKLMDENNLLVWAMNGEALPLIHGFPLRLIVPGWPGSVSAKWVTRIWIRDRAHDGQGMGGTSYRVPINPMVPGDKVDEKNFRDLESMPIRSIITNPSNGLKLTKGIREMTVRGAAWAGDNTVKEVHVSLDYGATWQKAKLAKPKNKYDWQRWDAKINFPSDGYFEIWTRGTDSKGVMQPHVAGNWNPQGYGANPMHRIAVLIG